MAFSVLPTPKPLKPVSTVFDLKDRLDWGEPALTIIDVRSREEFNNRRILGAISMPMVNLVDQAVASLEPSRDIYIYGDNNDMTAEAVSQLRSAGYRHVAEILGGLAAWKAVSGPTEGVM